MPVSFRSAEVSETIVAPDPVAVSASGSASAGEALAVADAFKVLIPSTFAKKVRIGLPLAAEFVTRTRTRDETRSR